MEVGSRGFETHGVNKEADKIFNPELKDVMAPHSGQIPAGESITTSPPSAGLTDVQGKDKTLGSPTGTDTGAAPVAVFSFPPLTRDLNSVPSEMDFSSYEAVGIERDSQDEIQQIGEQEVFDDMVILEDDMVTSASLSGRGGGPGDAIEQFQVSDSHLMDSQHAPVPHTLPHTSVALEAPVEVNVNTKVDISLSTAAQDPIEENVDSVTQISLNVVSEVPAQEPSAASVLESSGFAVVEAPDELPLTQEKDVEAVPPAVEPSGVQPLIVDEPGEAVAGHLPTFDVVEAEPVPEVMDVTADSDLPAPEGDHAHNHESVGGSNEVTEQDIQSIKGQKVTKKFGRKNFVGDVVDYDPESKWFKIVYEDGDEEDLELWEVKLILSSSHSLCLSSKKRPHTEEGADGDFQKNTKKPKKSGAESTVKKKTKGGAKSSDKSPRTPGSQAKGSKKSSATKQAKSPGKSNKKAFDSPSFKTPRESQVKGGKGKGKSGARTPESSKGVSTKKKKTGKVLNLQSPKTQKKGKAKTTPESSGLKKDVKSLRKGAKIEDTPKQPTSVAKRKAEGEGTAEVKSKRPKKGVTEAGASGKVGIYTFIGKHVKKNFGGTLYDGVVVKLDKKTQYYKVKYEDGDQEDLEVHELEPILVREVGSTGDPEEKPAKLSSLSTLMSQEKKVGIQSVKKKK